jgi:hypothetical protein
VNKKEKQEVFMRWKKLLGGTKKKTAGTAPSV